MTRQTRILAGTALGLLMASAPFGAALAAAQTAPRHAEPPAVAPIILAQEGGVTLEEEQPEAPQAEEQPQRERPARAERRQQRQEQQAQPEQAPAEAPAQAEEAQPQAEQPARAERRERRQQERREQQAQPEQAPAEEAPAQAEEQPEGERPSRAERRREGLEQLQQRAQPEEAPAAEEAPAQAEEQPEGERPSRAERRREGLEQLQQRAQPEEAPAAEEAPAQAEEQPEGERPSRAERREQRRQERQQQAQPEQQPDGEETPAQAEGEQPEGEAEQARPEPRPGEEPAEQQARPEGAPDDGRQAGPDGEAPILDSAKEAPPATGGNQQAAPGEQQEPAGEGGQQAAQPPAEAGPPPASDAEAQATIRPEEIVPVTREEGRRIELDNSREARREWRREHRQRRENTEVVREFEDNRTIIQIDNRVYIDSPDYERLIRDNDDVYYEELPRGRQREVITRADGTRIVTVRNRYGDIVRRSRVLPDDREVVLVYVEDRYYDDQVEWRDPGRDLPPLRLNIPREDYILEATADTNPDYYYDFFEQPPVEKVTRTYSIEEVKRSARVRDIARRVDLDTINFEFGSDQVAESEVRKLESVAQAMDRLLEKNPAETFLIEGHTDAVGSDTANLALSDRRAESVARALTNVFGIPPENLATQGYGEQYLKVNTEEPERENRRVALRRITALVAPVASAQ